MRGACVRDPQRLGTAASAAHQIATQLFWFLAFVPEALTPVAQMLIGQVRIVHQYKS